jgi:hypothetical protein
MKLMSTIVKRPGKDMKHRMTFSGSIRERDRGPECVTRA